MEIIERAVLRRIHWLALLTGAVAVVLLVGQEGSVILAPVMVAFVGVLGACFFRRSVNVLKVAGLVILVGVYVTSLMTSKVPIALTMSLAIVVASLLRMVYESQYPVI